MPVKQETVNSDLVGSSLLQCPYAQFGCPFQVQPNDPKLHKIIHLVIKQYIFFHFIQIILFVMAELNSNSETQTNTEKS